MTYDAMLWLSFGGPEGPEEVMPFLRNVTRGRGVPDERLAEVARHYHHFGGISPINKLNWRAIAAVEQELIANGFEMPVYFGNRNWPPMVEDAVSRMLPTVFGARWCFPPVPTAATRRAGNTMRTSLAPAARSVTGHLSW